MNLYTFRESVRKIYEKSTGQIRKAIRRDYIRRGIKHYMTSDVRLSKEQKKELREYWGKYTKHFSPVFHEFYLQKNGVFDVRYIPEDLMHTEIEEVLNDWNSAHGIDNKCNYTMYFPFVRQPKILFRKMRNIWHDGEWKIISKDHALQNCISEGRVILKHAVESGRCGGVSFWSREDGVEKLKSMIETLPEDAVAQSIIEQHPDLAKLNPSSVNCIRVVTLATQEGIRYICSYLRMGQNGGNVDLIGGCTCTIQPDGRLNQFGVENDTLNVVDHHACGVCFKDYKVPYFQEIVDAAMRMHERMGDFRIISWDMSLSPLGEPILIEANLKYGGTKYHQLGAGPMFGEYTDTLLDEVYSKR